MENIKMSFLLHFECLAIWVKISADDIWNIFLICPENCLWHFMQIISLGDILQLHDMSKPKFMGKK